MTEPIRTPAEKVRQKVTDFFRLLKSWMHMLPRWGCDFIPATCSRKIIEIRFLLQSTAPGTGAYPSDIGLLS